MYSDILSNLNAYLTRIDNLFSINVTEIGVAFIIFILFMLLRKLFTGYIFNLIYRISSKRGTELDKNILNAFENPLRFFFIVLGIYVALIYLPLEAVHQMWVGRIFRSAIIILTAAGFYNLFDANSVLLKRIQTLFDIELDRTLIPFLSKFIRLLVVIFTFTIVAQEWNYDINGLIAGLGLGGLAIALAARDALANIFGGIVIIIDKPFRIGDWISTSNLEGTVEELTFRSTKVRTFAHSIVTVPNSTLANDAITNWSRMGKRRITFNLGVTYSTPKDKLVICIAKIKDMLHNHPDIHKETIFVNFDKFNESSLDIFLYFFTITTNWGEYLRVREDIHLKILEILEADGVNIAFPSRSIYIDTPSSSIPHSIDLDSCQ